MYGLYLDRFFILKMYSFFFYYFCFSNVLFKKYGRYFDIFLIILLFSKCLAYILIDIFKFRCFFTFKIFGLEMYGYIFYSFLFHFYF